MGRHDAPKGQPGRIGRGEQLVRGAEPAPGRHRNHDVETDPETAEDAELDETTDDDTDEIKE